MTVVFCGGRCSSATYHAQMGELWTEAYKLKTWLQVGIAVCEAQAELGYIPASAVGKLGKG